MAPQRNLLLCPQMCGVRKLTPSRGGTPILVEQATQPITPADVAAMAAATDLVAERSEWWPQPKRPVRSGCVIVRHVLAEDVA